MTFFIKDLIDYFNGRDNDSFIYSPQWSIAARTINNEVWYECYYKPSDTLSDTYDYSSTDLREVLEYMNSCTGDVVYY